MDYYKKLVIMVIAFFTMMRLDLLMSIKYPPWWDVAFYLTHIRAGDIVMNFHEPVYFAIAHLINLFTLNEVATMKILMLAMPIVLSIGTWMLMRRYSSKSALVSVVAVNILIGMNRIWADLNRNYMLVALLPFWLMLFFDDIKKGDWTLKTWLLTAFSITLCFVHSTAIVLLPLFVWFMVKKPELRFKLGTVLLLTFIAYMSVSSLLGASYGMSEIASNAVAHGDMVYADTAGLLITKFYYLCLFSSGTVFFLLLYMGKNKAKGDFEKSLRATLACLLTVGMIPFFFVVTSRILMTATFFEALLIGIMFERLKVRDLSMKAMGLVMLIILAGFIYIGSLDDTLTDGEEYIISSYFSDPNSLFYTDGDNSAWITYLTGVDWKSDNYRLVNWKEFEGIVDMSSDTARIFAGNDTCRLLAEEKQGYDEIYLLYNIGFTIDDLNAPCLKVYWHDNETVFLRYKAIQ